MAQSVSFFFWTFYFSGAAHPIFFGNLVCFQMIPEIHPKKKTAENSPPTSSKPPSWGPKEKDDDTRHRAGESSDSSRGHEKLPSLKLTWNLKRRFLLETIIFRCYVSFREGTQFRSLRPIESGILGSSLWWILILQGSYNWILGIKQCIFMVNFEEFPIDSAALFGLVSFLMTPPILVVERFFDMNFTYGWFVCRKLLFRRTQCFGSLS